ncbi:MAG: indole-3-glycerol phosphate synthase TrpC [Caldilineaceae bacterium]|nr:indole-3-glycerol phosphate synthase TrpC [Caldilineaceae bacterium]
MKRSQLDIAKFQGRVLDKIMAVRRKEVVAAKRRVREEELIALARLARPAQDLAGALVREPGAGIIAEIKRASPSRGLIARDWDPAAMASAYVRGGAVALSCLTDKTHFQGDLAYLEQIGDRLEAEGQPVPVLRKDFIFDAYQVWEARAAGADALLLIMAVLGDQECRTLLDLVHATGMQALVEVHDEAELDRALALDARIIGVNNRNLRTFTVDLNTTRELRSRIPGDRVLVGESGITTAADAATMAEMGCDAILVGEAFSKLPQSRRERKVREFAAAGSLAAVEERTQGGP